MIPLIARRAISEDYPHFERMFAELGVPDPVPAPAAFAAEIAPRTIMLEEVAAGAVVAYGFFEVLGAKALVRHVVVDREWRRRGVGRTLMTEVAARLRAAGCTGWELYVSPGNLAAIGLYEASGMRTKGTACAMEMAWHDVGRMDTALGVEARGRPVAGDGSEDDAIETAFGLGSGELARHRASGAPRVLLTLEDPGAPGDHGLGLAVFRPEFPGARPFRVRRPDLAKSLLEAIRPYRRPSHDFVRIFVDDDDLLAALLVRGGAERQLELVRMGGALD